MVWGWPSSSTSKSFFCRPVMGSPLSFVTKTSTRTRRALVLRTVVETLEAAGVVWEQTRVLTDASRARQMIKLRRDMGAFLATTLSQADNPLNGRTSG